MFRFTTSRIVIASLFLCTFVSICPAQNKSDKSVTIVFKDGHQKAYSASELGEFKNNALIVNHAGSQDKIPVTDILRMDFSSKEAKSPKFSRNHFVGKWEFGEGIDDRTFFVTLDADGQAHKSIGAPHGTWVVVNNEARISWDDGWKDVIRKVGSKHEKFAFEPGKSLSDKPSNVAAAKTLNSEPI
jgi:hypothetical protein